MQIILIDKNPTMCKAWDFYFNEYEDVQIMNDTFEHLNSVDCMTSAANSFGIMDGGIDLYLSQYFGWDLMKKVQKRIIDDFCGEQPVGTSIIVETGHGNIPYLAHTPTMRVPNYIDKTDNVYKAMWGLLTEIHRFNKRSNRSIDTVAVCGLGTGVGKMPFGEAARQMYIAYKHYLNIPTYIGWDHAAKIQKDVKIIS